MNELKNYEGPNVCVLHDKYALRVNSMWGGFKIALSFIVIGFSVIGTIILDTRAEMDSNHIQLETSIAECREESIRRDQEISIRFLDLEEEERTIQRDWYASQLIENNNIIRVLNVISLNQKRTMDHLDLEYMNPEWVRSHDTQ